MAVPIKTKNSSIDNLEEKSVVIKVKESEEDKLETRKKRDKEMVKGIFRNHETPGGMMEFYYKLYKGDQVEPYRLVDGQMYTIPRSVARHLNTDCWYPVHKYATDENGKQIQVIGQKVRRCSFQSMDFMDIDESTPDLVTIGR